MKRTYILLIALSVCGQHGARADECKDGLIPDIVNVSYDKATSLALLNIMSSSQMSKYSKSSALSATGYGAFSEDKAGQQRADLYKKSEFKLNEEESLKLVIAKIPEAARLKFYDCIRGSKEIQLQIVQLSDETLIMRAVRGGTNASPDILELTWSTNDTGDFKQYLAEKVDTTIGKPMSAVPITNYWFNPKKGISLTVSARVPGKRETLATDTLTVPPIPDLPKGTWMDEKHSLPLKVWFHYAQVGYKPSSCFTINTVGEFVNGDATECQLRRDGIAGTHLGQTQELIIDWDKTATHSINSPFDLRDDELSFEYSCWYTNGTYSAKRGDKCGNEAGEPLLRKFSMKLTGSLKKYFKLTYSCVGENTVGPLAEGGICEVAGWRGIGQLKIEIVTDPK